MTRLILFFIFLLAYEYSFAQLKIEVGEYYLQNQKLQKLHVNAEDHSVWVINDAGKVYYKEKTQSAFSIFQPTAQLNVTEVVGYNMDEMYFLVNGELLYFKNRLNQVISFASDRKLIYSIVPIYGRYEIKADKSSDRLILGFAGANAELKRGQTVINQLSPDGEALDFRVHYYGLKSYSASIGKPQNIYCYESDRNNFSGNSQAIFATSIPDKSPYPVEKTSIILIEGAYASVNLNAWSTHEGIFIKGLTSCFQVYKRLDGQVVNAMEVVENLAFYNKNQFLIAATNNGLQYTPKRVVNTNLPEDDIAAFEPVQGLPQIKFTKVMAETSYIGSHWSNINIYCEKAIWATSENGIYRLYLNQDQSAYTNSVLTSLSYNKTPINNDLQSPIFNLCAGETVRVTNSIPNIGASQMLVQWFKDGSEELSLRGQLNTTLTNAGVYKCKVTLLCENISVSSSEITVNQAIAPEITFNYPPEINICPSGNYTFQTKAVNGYAYQWYKDDALIAGATQNQYTANSVGNYKVSVSNCAGNFLSSSTIKLNWAVPGIPIVSSNKLEYCIGETAMLKVENNSNYKIKWYYNNDELVAYADRVLIEASKGGGYRAEFINTEGCNSISNTFFIQFNELPLVTVTRNRELQLCSGESLILRASSSITNSTFLWSTGETSSAITVTQAGKYWAKATTSTGCSALSQEVQVIVNPNISIMQPEEFKICILGNERLVLQAESGFVTYTWNGLKSTRNFLEVSQPGNYELTVENVNGCKATVIYRVIAYCKEVLAPNTFSPNGDSVNDIWKIAGLENDSKAEIFIYSRSGNLVYKTTGKNAFWDGLSNGKQVPVGIYYYVIKTKNSVKAINGAVTIIR